MEILKAAMSVASMAVKMVFGKVAQMVALMDVVKVAWLVVQ